MGRLVKNSLGYASKLLVYQDKNMFNYSVDTILLANFVSITKRTRWALEVGTNNGALAIFLAERSPYLQLDAVEIVEEATQIALKNVAINNKKAQISIIHDDFKNFVFKKTRGRHQKYDLIICNPPFYKVEASRKVNDGSAIYIATHEVKLSLTQLISGAAKLIKQKGYLAIVLPTERIVDAFEQMRKYGFEPKRVQMIHPRVRSKSNLVLIEARFRAGWGVRFLPNIYLHYDDINNHRYRPEVQALYKPIKIGASHND